MSDCLPCPDASPFAVLEQAYVQLATGPDPLAVDGMTIAGRPDRVVPLVELRTLLLHPCCEYTTAETALQLLVERARRYGEAWTIGLIGVLLPGLRRAVAPLAAACPGRRGDLEAEMLAGLLRALDRVPPGRPRPAGWLIGRGFDAAKQLHRREVAEGAKGGGQELPDTAPGRPAGNPEVVLARAVGCGVLCADDAELIAATRLGQLSLADAASGRGVSYKTVARRRHRAESSLAAWIRGEFVADRAALAGSRGAGRPRQGRRPGQRPGLRHQPEPPTTGR